MFEALYDENEQANAHFIGFISETARYDFAIIFTNHFFGKPLVVCMQTGRSALLCQDDLNNLDVLQRVFNIRTKDEAEELAAYLQQRLTVLPLSDQY